MIPTTEPSQRDGSTVFAAVVTTFNAPPAYAVLPAPQPSSPDEVVVDVVASGLHPRVRSQAGGSHYTSTDELPLVPGIDGVGRTHDGQLRYFVLPDTAMGAMAERTVIDLRRSIVLPEGSDPVLVAAAMNPAMSSWIALRRRIDFEPGLSVLVLGATGNAGRLAVQVSRMLGAGRVVAAGRDADRLVAARALGADDTVSLDAAPEEIERALGEAASDVDIVLDYIWGSVTAGAMAAVVTHRTDRRKPLTWVAIGSVAGPTAAIPSAALRAARLKVVGSGQGSVSSAEIVEELPGLAAAVTSGAFQVDARAVPLADVAQAWDEAARTSDRLVLTM